MVATLLSRGGLAIVQVDTEDSDNPHTPAIDSIQLDSISFVLLAPVGSGTTIHFTDRAWNGTSFTAAGGDGTYTWTAGANLAAGTVITISEGELTAAGMELSDLGESIYVFQGTDANTPTTFLHAIDLADGNTTFNGNLANTGLVNGTSAVAVAADNVSFGERTWNHQTSVLFQNINNASNWHSNENSPHTDFVEGTNGHVAPDVQLWIAGISGGHGLFSVNGDATQNGGLGYNVAHHIQNSSVDGAGSPPSSTQRFWSPTHILFDTVAGKFFVVDSSGTHDRILQGNISDLLNNPGTAPTMTILWQDLPAVSDGDGVTSIQLDRTNGRVYFTADNTLLRVNYDAPNQAATTLSNLGNDPDSGSKNYANELVLDLAGNRAFIVSTETFSTFIESPPGSGNIVVGTTTYQNSIHLISNISGAPSATELTFAGGFGESLSSATGSPDPGNFEDFFGRITDVELNALNGDLWFTATQLNGGANGETGGIYRATLVGSTLTVTQMYSEGNGTNQNFLHIHIDEETGFYYVTSREPGESGAHAVYRGSLSAAPGTAPTLYADIGNINDMTPRDLTVESAPTLAGTGLTPGVTEVSSEPASGETTQVTLFSGLSASDIDTAGGDELAGATVRISGNFVRETSTIAGHTASQDYLTINDLTSGTIAASGITFSYDATTGVMTLSGAATVAEYAAALALVQFSASGDNPTLYGSATSRTVAASVFDGLLHSDEITTTVTVTGINDEPVNTVPGEQTISEDNTRVFSTANSNALSVGDADADPASQSLQVTLSVTQGTLTLASLTGLTFSTGDGTGDTTMTFTGTANAINAALGTGLTFTPIADYNGAATLTVTVNDQGLNGTGGALSDSDTVTITINAVADIANDGATTNEDTAVDVLVQGNDTFENPDHEITAFDQGANGTVTLDDNNSAADTTDDFLVYTPNADFYGSDSFTYTITSGGVTETATVNVTVNAVADIANDSATTDEDTAVDILVQGNDTFESAGHAITAFDQGADGTVALNNNNTVGDLTDDYFVYTPDADFNGTDSFTYTVTSGGVTETATVNVTVNAVDDLPVAVADGPSVNANVVTNIAVLGNDTDVDGGPKNVIEINGAAVSVGIPVLLASNATVTLNADGTIAYDPSGQFDYLVSPATALATGASNGAAGDSFSYTLNGGSSTTVTVSVLGVDEPGDELLGTPAVDTITGTGGDDVIRGSQLGDTLDGAGGNDRVIGNGGRDTLLGGLGDDDLAGGWGNDDLLGGAGADRLHGGLGSDELTGGADRDVFIFDEDSTGATHASADIITDFDQAANERIRLNRIDADVNAIDDQKFVWIGNGAFTGVARQLHFVQDGGNTYVEGDTDGDGNADFVIRLDGLHNLVFDDFML